MSPSEWQQVTVLWPVPLIDGGRSGWFANVMRRMVMDQAKYRAMTDKEEADDWRDMAW